MKIVWLSETKSRRYNWIDWVRENVYLIGCAVLGSACVFMAVLIIREIIK